MVASRLEHLTLRFKQTRSNGEDDERQLPPAPLHHLQSLKLTLDPSTLRNILTHIDAPISRHIVIRSTLEGILAEIHGTFDILIPLIKESHSVRINIGEGGLLLQNASQSLSLFLGQRSSGGVDQTTAGLIFQDLVRRMSPLVHHVPVTLSLGPDEALQKGILSFLSTPQPHGAMLVPAWPLAGLQALTLENADRDAPLGELRRLVQSRSRTQDMQGVGSNGTPTLTIQCRGRGWGFEDITREVLDGLAIPPVD